jgi:hypothetical protein
MSRWQLAIEPYTNSSAAERGVMAAFTHCRLGRWAKRVSKWIRRRGRPAAHRARFFASNRRVAWKPCPAILRAALPRSRARLWHAHEREKRAIATVVTWPSPKRGKPDCLCSDEKQSHGRRPKRGRARRRVSKTDSLAPCLGATLGRPRPRVRPPRHQR